MNRKLAATALTAAIAAASFSKPPEWASVFASLAR